MACVVATLRYHHSVEEGCGVGSPVSVAAEGATEEGREEGASLASAPVALSDFEDFCASQPELAALLARRRAEGASGLRAVLPAAGPGAGR